MYCKIDNLMYDVLKSEYIKLKKQILMLKYTKIFVITNANALTRPRLRDLIEKGAKYRRKFRQTKHSAVLHCLPQQLPPLCHIVVAEVEKGFTYF